MLFSEVYAPENIKKHLRRTVLDKKISHAQLFYGMEGTHSLGLALAYSQYINCQNRNEEDSCGICPSCRQFAKLAHPDLHFFFPHPAKEKTSSNDYYNEWRNIFTETKGLFTLNDWYERINMGNSQGSINKSDIDLLLSNVALKSYEAGCKVFIIWMVEKLYYQIAPKLLKTLEEPDGKTLFILITENYAQVLNTIVSRCQMLKINRFSTDKLAKIIQKEQNCSVDIAYQRAVLSENNVITALKKSEEINKVHNLLKLFQDMMRLAYSLYSPPKNFDIEMLTQWIAQVESLGREGQKQFLKYSLTLIRKCFLKNEKLTSISYLIPEEDIWTEKFKTFVREDNISNLYSTINESVKQIESNVNSKILFTDMVFSIGKCFKTIQIQTRN